MKKPLKSLLIFLRSLVFWCILLTTALQVMNLVLGKQAMSFMVFALTLLKFVPLASLLAMLVVFRFIVFSEANKPLTLLILFILMGVTVYFAIPAILTHVDGGAPDFSYSIAENENHSLFIALPEILKNANSILSDISVAFSQGMKPYLIFSVPFFFAFFMCGAWTFFTKWKMLNIVFLLTMFFGIFYAYSYIKAGVATPLLQRFNIPTNLTTPATFALIAGVLLVCSIILLIVRGIAVLIKKKRSNYYE